MANTIRTILWAGLAAGVLDITAAFIMIGIRGAGPDKVLQGIASGLLGAKAYRGGAVTVLLGGALHFLIAVSAAAIYYGASRKIEMLTKWPIVSGLLYGVLIYAFMNGIVLPLSAVFPRPTISAGNLIIGVVVLSCLVGLPISLITWRSSQAGSFAPAARPAVRKSLSGIFLLIS